MLQFYQDTLHSCIVLVIQQLNLILTSISKSIMYYTVQ